jgi:hypothetical protein
VQRANANGNYQTIGEVRPSVNQTDFSFSDNSLHQGTNLYRIKVNRFAGGIKYSNTVALVFDSEELFVGNIIPNPVHSVATLTLSAANPGIADITIYDLTGHMVKTLQTHYLEGNNNIDLDVSRFRAGVYHVVISTLTNRTVERFVKL